MATEDFHMTITYDPATPSITTDPLSITVPKNQSARILLNLVLSAGAQGSAVFDNPPLTWSSSTGSPPEAIVEPPTGGTSQTTIVDPNLLQGQYEFHVHVKHQVAGGTFKHSGDPTIINEGTGG